MDDEFTPHHLFRRSWGGERVSYGNSGVREGCDNPGGLWVEWMCVRGSPVNPDTQHYIITRQNTFRLYTTPNEREVVYIASPKQCSGGVLMLFLDMISYLAGYLYEFHTFL